MNIMSMNYEEYIVKHIKDYNKLQMQDVVKFCYQGALGAEHLIKDLDITSLELYFSEEYDSVFPMDTELITPLSDLFSRLNISAWKNMGFTKELYFDLFFKSLKSEAVLARNMDTLEAYLTIADEVILEFSEADYDLEFSADEWKKFKSLYIASNMPSVHHSEQYRRLFHPAYRVINNEFLKEYFRY